MNSEWKPRAGIDADGMRPSDDFDFGEERPTGRGARAKADVFCAKTSVGFDGASGMGAHGARRGTSCSRKRAAVIAAACALALCAAAGTFAWLSATGVLANQFGIGIVQPAVSETLSDAVKSDVSVRNDGSTPAYMRAQVDIYWQDANGARLWDEPAAGADYTIVWADAGEWSQGADGYWYWSEPVAPLASTGVLIKSVTTTANSAEKHLVVDVSTQAIQSTPADAVVQAWGCTVDDNGALKPPKGGEGA